MDEKLEGDYFKVVMKGIVLKKYNLLLSFLGACVCLYGCMNQYITRSGALVSSFSIFSLIVFGGFFAALYYINAHFEKRDLVIAIFPAVILAVCQRIGAEFSVTKGIDFGNVALYLSIVAVALIFWILISYMLHFSNCVLEKLEHADTKLSRIFKGKAVFWLFFAVIVICWIPAYLAVYPGVYSYDAVPKVLQVFGGEGITAHFPVLHTLLLNGCIGLGKVLFDSYNVGVLIYSTVSGVFMAAGFSYVLNWMWGKHISKVIVILGLLFLALNPVVQIMVFTTTHDTIFAGFLLLLFKDLIDAVSSPTEFFGKKSRIFWLVVDALLMCLFRNQGIYILVIMIPFLVWAVPRYRIKMFGAIVLAVVLTKVITGPLYGAFKIEAANPREALCVPIQQIARVAFLDPEAITPEEYEIVYRYIPEENLKRYIPETVDLVKEGFYSETFREDPMSFFKVWLSIGSRNLGTYIDSFLWGSYGYFYMEESPCWYHYILYDNAHDSIDILNIARDTKFETYDKYLRAVSYDMLLDKIPVISIVANEAFPFWLMVIAAAFVLRRKKYRFLCAMLLPLGYWGTLLLGPVIVVRYAFPLIVLVPLLAGICFQKDDML